MATPLYTQISAMEPMMPPRPELEDLAVEVIRESSALGASLHPLTRKAIARFLRTINSYYSNLIEGHDTRPAAIERAMKGELSEEPDLRARQIESRAHVEVESLLAERLRDEPDLKIAGERFLCWLHGEFYDRMPEKYHWVRRYESEERTKVTGGELRTESIIVGRHHGPAPEALPRFLARFSERYDPTLFGDVEKLLAAAASHHRLLWIHPFLDGNGRVTRLFTEAYLRRARIDADGVWSLSRGLARSRDRYVDRLAGADHVRRNDFDGRGNLSEAGLVSFCRFFLETALDQIGYMRRLLNLDDLHERVAGYVSLRHREMTLDGEPLPLEASYVLQEVVLRGEVPRGEVARIAGMSVRSARRLVARLLDEGLLESEGHKAPLRIGLPASVASYYFPELYPEDLAGAAAPRKR